MAGTTIGEVNINLRLSLAQFKTDVQDGTRAASDGTKSMANEIGSNSKDAQASLALIGEEIGVTIPRHIRTFITAIPGVGEALNAAFDSVAILAVIGVIAEVISKIQDFRKAAQDAADAQNKVTDSMVKTGAEGREAIFDLQAKFVGITQGPLAEMETRLGHVNELLQSMKVSDDINKQFKDLADSVKGVFYEIGSGTGGDELASFKKQLDSILTTQGRPAALDAIVSEVQRVNDEITVLRNNGDQSSNNAIISLQKYVTALTAVQQTVDQSISQQEQKHKVDVAAYAQARVDAETDANNKIITARNREIEQLEALETSTNGVLAKNLTVYDQEIEKVNNLIDGWVRYKASWETAHNGISVVANTEIEQLKQQLNLINQKVEAEMNELLLQHQQLGKETVQAVTTGQSPALYSGTKEAQDLYNIQKNSAAAIAESQKVYTATRTSAQQYAEEVDKLDELWLQGRIDLDTYNKAIDQAKQKYDDTTIAVKQFGTDIADALKSGALWGSNWKDTLESIAIDLAQLILKLTLIKSLQASTTATGAGGFWSSLLSGFAGITGKASGGSVYSGQPEIVGELGPELFVPGSNGTIVPHDALMRGSGGSTGPISNTFVFQGVTDHDSFRKSKDQIASDMFGMLARAQRRNG